MKTTFEEERKTAFLLEKMTEEKLCFQDIINKKLLSSNRAVTFQKLKELVNEGLVKEENRSTWKQGQKLWHVTTPKGERWLIERQTESLKEAVKNIKPLIEDMLKPVNVWRWQREGTVPLPERFPVNTDPDAPASINLMTEEEWREFWEHKEKMFGGLHDCFFALAQVVMKAAIGSVNAEEDLSNVTVRFRNGRALWYVDASKYGRLLPEEVAVLEKKWQEEDAEYEREKKEQGNK